MVDVKKNYNIVFDKTNFRLAINYVIDNIYFTGGNSTFKKVIEISMVSDPVLFMANLLGKKLILNLKKSYLDKKRSFSNTF